MTETRCQEHRACYSQRPALSHQFAAAGVGEEALGGGTIALNVCQPLESAAAVFSSCLLEASNKPN